MSEQRARRGDDPIGDRVNNAVPAGEDADRALPEVPDPVKPPIDTRKHRRLLATTRVVLPVLVGAGVIAVGASAAGGVNEAAGLLRHVQLRWLWLAAVCELAQYAALAVHVSFLAGPATNTRRVGPCRTALVVFGLGSVLPAAPAEGLALASTTMLRRGLARRRIALVLGLSQWFNMATLYLVTALSALVFVSLSGAALPHGSAIVLAAAGTLVFLAAVTFAATRASVAEWVALALDRLRWWRKPRSTPNQSRQRGAAWHAAIVHVVGGPRGFAILAGTAAAAWIADAFCLHIALVAFGVHVSLPVLLFAYSAGTLAGAAPLLPAGLGAVETATPAVLALAGVPAQTSLAAIVIYRAFSTVLPALGGLIAYLGLRLQTPPTAATNPLPNCTPPDRHAPPRTAQPGMLRPNTTPATNPPTIPTTTPT